MVQKLLPVIAALCFATPLRAQDCPEAQGPNDSTLARRYAPILGFGPGERYFPTIPFFTAFDTIGGKGDLSDSARVAPLGKEGRISWNSLDTAYRSPRRLKVVPNVLNTFVPANSAVFYRVRCLRGKQKNQLWGFLRNDPQAWQRTGLDSLYAKGLRDAEFAVVEYYLYYLRDTGLQGHEHDIERILVFIPRRIDIARALRRKAEGRETSSAGETSPDSIAMLADSLLIVVGTGHSVTTPNNVLVLLNGQAHNLELPSVLVELGGHSSAPDMNLDSELHIGLDVNWNISESVWGTRDAQAVSGMGFLGKYQSWMTLPRKAGVTVTLSPRPAPKGPADVERRMAQEEKEKIDTKRDSILDVKQDATAKPLSLADTSQYSLLPVSYFKDLARYVSELPRARSAADSNALADSVRHVVDDSIRPLLKEGWGFEGFPKNADYSVIIATMTMMRHWGEPLQSGDRQVSASKTTIWEHSDYKGSPIWSLKRRLYRPTANGIQNVGDVVSLLTANYSAYLGSGGQQFQLGVLFPVIKSKIDIAGMLEAQFGLYRRRFFTGEDGPTRPSVSLLYERHHKRVFSWYARPFSYVKKRAEIEGDPEASDVVLGFGASVMPFFPVPQVLKGMAQRLRIRAGIRIDAKDWEPSLRRFELQTTMYVR